ncbi:hypothetical protein LV75_002616 [Actinokineospora diospyrosa]|uniref:Syndecan 1 n=1 Tax=Actinokineospora diospyrosa TaxID=103728 RepID=A0ABT1IBV4_9PSEU|nr:hypothetical protein [Actinokineospora diospyrosa]
MSFWDRFRGTRRADARPAWDGGWRAVAPLAPVSVRGGVSVSDGLVFRSTLSSWHDPSLVGEMAHSVSATAPSGVAHGVVRPATGTAAARGPLLFAANNDRASHEPTTNGSAANGHGAPPGLTPATPETVSVQRSIRQTDTRAAVVQPPESPQSPNGQVVQRRPRDSKPQVTNTRPVDAAPAPSGGTVLGLGRPQSRPVQPPRPTSPDTTLVRPPALGGPPRQAPPLPRSPVRPTAPGDNQAAPPRSPTRGAEDPHNSPVHSLSTPAQAPTLAQRAPQDTAPGPSALPESPTSAEARPRAATLIQRAALGEHTPHAPAHSGDGPNRPQGPVPSTAHPRTQIATPGEGSVTRTPPAGRPVLAQRAHQASPTAQDSASRQAPPSTPHADTAHPRPQTPTLAERAHPTPTHTGDGLNTTAPAASTPRSGTAHPQAPALAHRAPQANPHTAPTAPQAHSSEGHNTATPTPQGLAPSTTSSGNAHSQAPVLAQRAPQANPQTAQGANPMAPPQSQAISTTHPRLPAPTLAHSGEDLRTPSSPHGPAPSTTHSGSAHAPTLAQRTPQANPHAPSAPQAQASSTFHPRPLAPTFAQHAHSSHPGEGRNTATPSPQAPSTTHSGSAHSQAPVLAQRAPQTPAGSAHDHTRPPSTSHSPTLAEGLNTTLVPQEPAPGAHPRTKTPTLAQRAPQATAQGLNTTALPAPGPAPQPRTQAPTLTERAHPSPSSASVAPATAAPQSPTPSAAHSGNTPTPAQRAPQTPPNTRPPTTATPSTLADRPSPLTAALLGAPQPVQQRRTSGPLLPSTPLTRIHAASTARGPQTSVQRKPTLGRDTALVHQAVPTAEPSQRPVVRPRYVEPAKPPPPAVRQNPTPPVRAPAPSKPAPPARTPPRTPAPVQRSTVPAKRLRPEKAPGQDLEELARGLLDPLMRLLRAELRHGRERAGRRNDHRR